MNLIIFLVIGALAGWLAGVILLFIVRLIKK